MLSLSLKPTHKPVKAYYESLGGFHSLGVSHEELNETLEVLNAEVHQLEERIAENVAMILEEAV